MPLSLLLVDDDEVDRLAVRRALTKAGWADIQVHEQERAAEAVTALTTGSFDCAILDFYMIGGTALEVVERVRAIGNRTPIIVLTGQGDERIAVNLMKAGASDYLAKSQLSSERLDQSLRYVLRVREAEMRAAEARASLHYLTEVSDVLAHSLEFDTTATHLLNLIVGRVADYAALYLQDDSNQIARFSELHGASIADYLPEAQLTEQVDTFIASLPHAADHRGPWSGFHSDCQAAFVAMPLVARGQYLGALALVRAGVSAPLSSDELELFGEVARRAAMALDNARLYQLSREATQMRDAFLSIASHELRTPITTIQGYADLLWRRHSSSDAREGQIVSTIARQARRLNRMLESLFDLSRIDSGQLSIVFAEVNLSECLASIVGDLAETLTTHQLTFDDSTAGESCVWGDALRLEQVMNNLIQNAVKYSPAGGTIRVALARSGDRVHFSVQDSGMGIATSAIPHLFDRFYRVAHPAIEKISGSGLGLFVVREIVSQHQGTINVQSRLGSGSTFTVELPWKRCEG